MKVEIVPFYIQGYMKSTILPHRNKKIQAVKLISDSYWYILKVYKSTCIWNCRLKTTMQELKIGIGWYHQKKKKRNNTRICRWNKICVWKIMPAAERSVSPKTSKYMSR